MMAPVCAAPSAPDSLEGGVATLAASGGATTMQCMEKPPEKTAQVTLRMTEAEREAWEEAARLDGRTLSAWIVRRCNGEPSTAPVLSSTAAVSKPRKPRGKRKAR